MFSIPSRLAAAGLLLATAALLPACGRSYEDVRPNPSSLSFDDTGLQSKDLIEMTDRMAPSMLQIPEITQNPNTVTVVLKPIQNQLQSDPGRNLAIYGQRMADLLNEHARDRVTFVPPRAELQRLQSEELDSNPDPFETASRHAQPTPSGRIQPQFVLNGVFQDMPNRTTNYYLCTFQLINLRTGQIVWQNHYEVKTLNI